jgi:hypothetical protein
VVLSNYAQVVVVPTQMKMNDLMEMRKTSRVEELEQLCTMDNQTIISMENQTIIYQV